MNSSTEKPRRFPSGGVSYWGAFKFSNHESNIVSFLSSPYRTSDRSSVNMPSGTIVQILVTVTLRQLGSSRDLSFWLLLEYLDVRL